MGLKGLIDVLCSSDDTYEHPTLLQLILLVRVASLIKNKILVVYPSSFTGKSAPPILPEDSQMFPSATCSLSTNQVGQCWSLLKDEIWADSFAYLHDLGPLFLREGVHYGFRKSFPCCLSMSDFIKLHLAPFIRQPVFASIQHANMCTKAFLSSFRVPKSKTVFFTP